MRTSILGRLTGAGGRLAAAAALLSALALWYYPRFLPSFLDGQVAAYAAAGGWVVLAHFLVLAAGMLALSWKGAGVLAWGKGRLLLLFFLASGITLILLGNAAAMRAALSLLWLAGGGLGLQWLLQRRLALDIPFHAACLALLVGIEGVLLLTGAFGAATPPVHALLAAAPAALCAAALSDARFRQRLGEALRNWEPGAAEAFWLEGFFLLAAMALVNASLPETLVDAAQLHTPKSMLMAAAGGVRGILDYPYQPFYSFPSFIHVLFSFGHTLLGQAGSKAVSTAMLVPWLGAVLHLGRLAGAGRTAASAVATMALGVPAFFWMAGSGYIDFPATVLAVSGTALLAEVWLGGGAGPGERGQELRGLALLAGMLLAGAANAKLNLYLFAAALWAGFAVHSLLNGRGARLRATLLLALGGLLVCLPHWGVMFALTDNPFYPLLNRFFLSPYWDNSVPVAQFSFHHFTWRELLLLPYYAVAKTSWFGENLDGSGGMWLLLFMPCLAFLRGFRRDGAACALVVGSALYGVLLACTGAFYYRYYMPVFPLLGVAMAMGARNFASVPGWPARKGLGGLAAALLVLLTLPQLQLSFAPTVFHWDAYRTRGGGMRWLGLNYAADLGPFLAFAAATPPEARLVVDGLELTSAMPRLAHETDIATMNFSGLKGVGPGEVASRRSSVGRWLSESVLGFSYPDWASPRAPGARISENPFEAMVQCLGDMYVVANIWSYANHAAKTGLASAERLVYSSSVDGVGGVRPRFLTAFRVNDAMFPPPRGVGFRLGETEVDAAPPLLEPPGWLEHIGGGNMKKARGLADPLTQPGGALYAGFRVPPGSAVLNVVLNLRFPGEPDLAAGLGLQFYNGEGRLLHRVIPSIFSGEGQPLAAYVVRQPVPAQARHLLIILSASPGKKIGIRNYSMFFEQQ